MAGTYGDVLAELKRKRAKLDAAIEALEELSLETPVGRNVSGPSTARIPERSSSTRVMLRDLLKQAPGKRLTTPDAVRGLLGAGWQSNAKNLYSNVYTMLKRMAADGEVKKSGKAWRLIEG